MENIGTKWSEIISDYAMLIIDDSRLQDSAAISPAQFLRRMSLYMQSGISLFNRPPAIIEYLAYELKLPTYSEYIWTSTEESTTQETVIDTGELDFELMSAVLVVRDNVDNTTLYPYSQALYDPLTGTVTMPIQESAGLIYSFDFYTDGEFYHSLTTSQKRILGECAAFMWDTRFSRNWQSMTPKLGDRNSKVIAEDRFMKSSTETKTKNSSLLQENLRDYEQKCAYLSPNETQKFV